MTYPVYPNGQRWQAVSPSGQRRQTDQRPAVRHRTIRDARGRLIYVPQRPAGLARYWQPRPRRW